ncbi:MAG: hypothetical protein NT165_03905 [Candidatus Falkowbacteria bacterium]|nr:hypothetical protein [Candidatus Falkowbacteria bacterium]
MRKKIIKGAMMTLGYLLSPLSWWNDLFFNIPLAYGFAFLFGLISQKLFFPMMVFGYLLTNVLGFMLMHHGAKGFFLSKSDKYTRRELKKDLIFSLLYTVLIVFLLKMGWLRFPTEYFK